MPHSELWRGHRVRLRALQADDWQVFHVNDRDSHSARLADEIKLPESPAQMQARFEKLAERSGHDTVLVIEALEDDAVVGSVNVHGSDARHRSFEYGVHVFAKHRRQGFAIEAISLLLRFYFRELGYHRAWSTVYSFNAPSIALQQAMGFVAEGTTRESLFTDGRFYDELIFGLLESEFEPLEQRLPAVPITV